MLTEYQRGQLDTVMNRFDFARVRRTMIALDWTWAYLPETFLTTDGLRIPEEIEIRLKAEEMLIDALEGRSYSTAGLSANYERGHLCLQFIVSHADHFGEGECL